MADVFISYAGEDQDRVRALAEALEARGYSVWWDSPRADDADSAEGRARELHAARAVVVVWSKASIRSTAVRDEAARAKAGGQLLPVLFDRVIVPIGFGAYEPEDFTRWKGAGKAAEVRRFEATLRAKLGGWDGVSIAIARNRRKLMARVRIAAALVVIALVAAVATGVPRATLAQQQAPAVSAH